VHECVQPILQPPLRAELCFAVSVGASPCSLSGGFPPQSQWGLPPTRSKSLPAHGGEQHCNPWSCKRGMFRICSQHLQPPSCLHSRNQDHEQGFETVAALCPTLVQSPSPPAPVPKSSTQFQYSVLNLSIVPSSVLILSIVPNSVLILSKTGFDPQHGTQALILSMVPRL